MNFINLLTVAAMLLGGLTFFLFGMNTMSTGLEQMAGGKLEHTMKKVTSNDFSGFFLGAGITIAIQSSSAMTVMLVGLVNSGIMAASDTFGMLMGSNVGTTLTAWILTLAGINGNNSVLLTILQPDTFAPILAFVGIAIRMFSQKEKKKNMGLIFIGFAILMQGMSLMKNSMNGIADTPAFRGLLTAFESPALALIASTVFTGIIQSSAATVAIVQALTVSGTISYQLAMPLIIGANIGTCVTALISCIGTNKEAKRVVAMHIYIKAIGGILAIAVMYIIMAFSPTLMISHKISAVGVAVVHSLFNIINTVIFIPFKKPVIKLCEKTVRSDNAKAHTVFLDERLFNNVPIAVSECHRLTCEMAEYARDSLIKSIGLISKYDNDTVIYIRDVESLIDKYEDKLGTYLVKLSNGELTESTSHSIARMLHSIGDFERIGDHALNICKLSEELHQKNLAFSGNALNELNVIASAITEIINITVDSFINDDPAPARSVEPLEQVIDKLKKELKNNHVSRLQSGECTIELGFIFTDLLTNYERVSDHCSNVAVYTIQLNTDKLDTHKYLNKFKSKSNKEFMDMYNMYEKKYSISRKF